MQDRCGRDGEEPIPSRTAAPPMAKAYFLRVLQPQNAQGSQRNLREMETLCHALDHLAMGRIGEASDMLMQRLKSVEKATQDNHWEFAKWRELIVDQKA